MKLPEPAGRHPICRYRASPVNGSVPKSIFVEYFEFVTLTFETVTGPATKVPPVSAVNAWYWKS